MVYLGWYRHVFGMDYVYCRTTIERIDNIIVNQDDRCYFGLIQVGDGGRDNDRDHREA
jgi:hypothetical protein